MTEQSNSKLGFVMTGPIGFTSSFKETYLFFSRLTMFVLIFNIACLQNKQWISQLIENGFNGFDTVF